MCRDHASIFDERRPRHSPLPEFHTEEIRCQNQAVPIVILRTDRLMIQNEFWVGSQWMRVRLSMLRVTKQAK